MFEIEAGEDAINQLNFSQRRYEGFRGKVEFDKKRLVMSSKNKYSVYSYENYMCDKAYLLLEEELAEHDEIVYLNFLEDIVPKFIILIVNDTSAKKSRIMVQQIVKTPEFFRDANLEEPSNETMPPVNDVRQQLNDKVNKGHLKKQRRRSDENIQLIVNNK